MNDKFDMRSVAERAATRQPEAAQPTLERFMETGERLLGQQRQRLLALRGGYERDRVTLLDQYRVRLAELETEAREALRSLEARHGAEMAGVRSIVGKLTAMRDA